MIRPLAWILFLTVAPTAIATDPASEWSALLNERKNWWSLQPLRRPSLPPVRDAAWARNPVDRFILARMESANQPPATPATRTILARRLAFVLTGVPPTPQQMHDVENDPSPMAIERLVEMLLASPQFGERLARHWMDVVRYSDTYGYEWDIPAKGAWRYRDYLTRAFNADVPVDQLIREQIAGDLLERPRIEDGINQSLIGPMFFQMGEKRHGDSAEFNGIHQEMLHDKIDAFSKAFQALTVGCARCHDHKLDAVSQRDYYALGGMFFSPRWVTNTLDDPGRNRAVIDRLREIKRLLRPVIADWWRGAGIADRWPSRVGAPPLPIEHPLHGWQVLNQPGTTDVAAKWKELAATYQATSAQRAAANARDFRVVADFTRQVPAGWSVDGVGLRDGPGRSGDFTVSLGGAVLDRVLPAGLFTDAISPRLNGAVRSPLLRTFEAPALVAHVAGGDFSAERIVVDNAFLTERQTYLSSRETVWRRVSTFPEMKSRRIYVEYATKTSNPNFPPRVGLGGACSEAQAADPRSWFGLTRVLATAAGGPPADELRRFHSLFAGDAPTTLAEAQTRFTRWFAAAIEAWAKDAADEEHVRLLNWLLEQKLLPNDENAAPAPVREHLAAYRAAEREILDPATVNGMAEIDPAEDYRLNVRGDYDRLGDAVPRGYLPIFAVATPKRGSGRRDLANVIASPRNPLTARVYVNRVWQWIFGTGLVASVDDFGHLGERPSHPELLDYLAGWLIDQGWSTKRLVRLLVTSQTFQQSSLPSAGVESPALLHHYPVRRLEAEAVRDAMLMVSGRLDRRLGGPPINPHRTSEDAQKRLFSGPVDGEGRRSLYIKATIMEPPRFLAAFNQPPPKIPSGRRDVTNVPAQALAMLNDPLSNHLAEYWARTLAASPDLTLESRLQRMFREALGRFPREEELRRWSGLIADLAAEHRVSPDRVMTAIIVWKDVAHTLFNTKEFLYVR